MAAGDTTITIVGNLVDDPELRFTPTGQAVARFRIASTPRFLDKTTNEWKDGEGLFLTCNVWRQAAENVAESLQRGMRVIVQGRLRQRSYETKEGEKRTVYEVEVDEVGPSLRNATAKVNKTARQGGQQGGGGFGGGPANDPWSSAAPAAPQGGGGFSGGGGGGGNNYGGGGQQGGQQGGGGFGGGDFSDEPPF
ncbi:single-stranded DNA-binding protein [Streptosporangium sp. DT93]|uniref:single-stranded DNA-binding protein n=1 Tax=Streptosporangium sp. DT93 TaxID=3393428 RepID=UPI003CE74DB0